MKYFKKLSIILFIFIFTSFFSINLFASEQEDAYKNTYLYNATNTYYYKYYENSKGKKPIFDENGIQTSEEIIEYDNDYRYDFTKETGIPVETGKANITILTHGLSGDASHWSNNGNGYFAFNEKSIINRLYNIYGTANVYWLSFNSSYSFDLINITSQIESNTENNKFKTTNNIVDSITDITKHLIIIFDAFNSNSSNDYIYSQFNYGISNIVYQYKQLNNGILPKINLI